MNYISTMQDGGGKKREEKKKKRTSFWCISLLSTLSMFLHCSLLLLLSAVSGAKLVTRRVQTSKCHYTLVFKEELCPAIQTRGGGQNMHQDSAEPSELKERVDNVERLLTEEKLRNQQLSRDLAQQMSQLKNMADDLQLQVNNVTTVGDVVGVVRKEQAKQSGRMRSMEQKLGGLLLDVNEVSECKKELKSRQASLIQFPRK